MKLLGTQRGTMGKKKKRVKILFPLFSFPSTLADLSITFNGVFESSELSRLEKSVA